MEIGQENDVISLIEGIAELTLKVRQALTGTIAVQLNGQTVNASRFNDDDKEELRNVLIDSYCRSLAVSYVALAAYGITYTPDITDAADIKAAMIAKYGAVTP